MTDAAVRDVGTAGSRRKARVVALQVLYEMDKSRHAVLDVLDRRLDEADFSKRSEAFARRLVEGVLENLEKTDRIITAFAPAWPISQIADVDRNILRLAVFEIMMGSETPPKVAINEAVELGKIFGSDSSPKFVNGVLGSLMRRTENGPES